MALLGYGLAQKIGAAYEQAVVSRICDVLDLPDTRITLTPGQKARLAAPHSPKGRPGHNWDMPAFAGAGALRSTANDLLKFLAANLHPLIPYTPGDADSYAVALAADKAIVEAAIAMGGTATGEHGVGIGKRQFMALEHGDSLKAMRAIKAVLDPNGILNPGKMFETDEPAPAASAAPQPE